MRQMRVSEAQALLNQVSLMVYAGDISKNFERVCRCLPVAPEVTSYYSQPFHNFEIVCKSRAQIN